MLNKTFIIILFTLIALSCNNSKISNTEISEKMEETVPREKKDIIVQNIQNLKTPIIEAVVFSDNVNVRNAPTLSGKVIKKLNNGDIIEIYDQNGSNEFNNGIWDRWYKISNADELWINAYYIAYFPLCIYQPTDKYDWLVIMNSTELKNTNDEIINLIKDDPKTKRDNFALRITNDKVVKSIVDNLSYFEYDKKEGADIIPYWHYEIIINNYNNVGKKLFYDIKIGDSLESISEKIGIEKLPEYWYTIIYEQEIIRVSVEFKGESVLEEIILRLELQPEEWVKRAFKYGI